MTHVLTEIAMAFGRLGLTAFGGPIAHLGYFRDEFVHRRKWLDEAEFARIVALCQFLPGPTSSQVGFAIGLGRAGITGALIAFAAFTLPSAMMMLGAALWGADVLGAGPLFASGVIHGLKLVAIAVVAHAVWGMMGKLTPDAPRALIAVAALTAMSLLGGFMGSAVAILLGVVAGFALPDPSTPTARQDAPPIRSGWAVTCGVVFILGVFVLPAILQPGSLSYALAAMFRAGGLVFGGGHVVLPLLEPAMVAGDLIPPDIFLAGYGIVQAVPGPLFTIGAYLGAVLGGVWGGIAGLIAIFAPGFLILIAAQPLWNTLSSSRFAGRALTGANAAVVGLLAAALYDPLITSTLYSGADLALVSVAFVALRFGLAPVPVIVLALAMLGGGLSIAF